MIHNGRTMKAAANHGLVRTGAAILVAMLQELYRRHGRAGVSVHAARLLIIFPSLIHFEFHSLCTGASYGVSFGVMWWVALMPLSWPSMNS